MISKKDRKARRNRGGQWECRRIKEIQDYVEERYNLDSDLDRRIEILMDAFNAEVDTTCEIVRMEQRSNGKVYSYAITYTAIKCFPTDEYMYEHVREAFESAIEK